MIKVIDRALKIPPEEKEIGHDGDNNVEIRQFSLTEAALFDFDFKLDIKKLSGEPGIIDLVKTIETDRIILTWNVLKEHLESGNIYIQLRAFSGNNEIWHSSVDSLTVRSSINATDYFPSPLPSEFEQMEQRVTAMQTNVTETAAEVESGRSEVAANTQTVIDKTDEALQSAIDALQSANNAKASEDDAEDSNQSALTAMNTTVQALQDLLVMMGNDIATLTGGKLTPSQIPAIAITDTFVVGSETAMLALTCETGDIAIRNDLSETYILQGTDPSKLTDWQKLKVPTNYADTAGHAATADEAMNATKINGHRVVYMTQTQYDNAVKDPDTVYMVGD